MPKLFGSLAATTAAYLHNRTPKSNTDGGTQQEILLKGRLSIKHLQVFGSWAFVNIPQEIRKKLDHRAIRYRFVGYLSSLKALKFWNPLTKEFVESAHARELYETGSGDGPGVQR